MPMRPRFKNPNNLRLSPDLSVYGLSFIKTLVRYPNNLGSVPRLVVGDSWDQYDFTFQMQLNSTIDQLKNDQTFLLHIRFTLKSDCSSRGNYVLYRDKNFFDTAGLRI